MVEAESTAGTGKKYEFEPLLDSQQAAELMRVHPETVKRRARSGEIPGMKFGKLWRFPGRKERGHGDDE